MAHTAPKHHFDDLETLVTALAKQQFKAHLKHLLEACAAAK